MEVDELYLTHIADAGDVDWFHIDVAAGDRLIVNLSNLEADFDVSVYGRGKTTSIVPLVPSSGQSAGTPVPDPEIALDGTTQIQSAANDGSSAFSPVLDAQVPLLGSGNRRGAASETVVTAPLDGGRIYIKVAGANGATSFQPAVLQARTTQGAAAPECPAITLPAGVAGAPSSIPANANTIILANPQRLSAMYGTDSAQVTQRLDQLVGYLNGPGAANGIVPAVVNVGAIPGIAGRYQAWDANPCDSELANAVVGAITAQISSIRETHDIQHVMIVGGDDVIPMARVTDGADVSNEFDYRYTFGTNNAVAGAAWDSQVLTDEPYGDTAALDFGDRYLYVTDAALGRLVDTPTDIAFQLDQFVAAQGALNPETGLVVGYDFLDDSSEAIASDLGAAGLDVDAEFGTHSDDDSWTATDLEDKLFPVGGTTPDVISINAHFDHRRALPADGNTTGDESDLFLAGSIFSAAPGSLTGRVTFSMGCHSALSVSDRTIGELSDDFAQALTRQGGVYVGNTGFGYGDTDMIAYSERLMELFGESLVNPTVLNVTTGRTTTSGQALQFAKNDFLAELGSVSTYDEKALMEATFYGVPFYRVTVDEPSPLAATPTRTATPDPVTSQPTSPVSLSPANALDADSTDGVSYYNSDPSGDPLELKVPFNPVQPLEVVDVSIVDPARPTDLRLTAHGALILQMQSEYLANDPVIVKPVTDGSELQTEPAVADVQFPASPAVIRTTEQPEGTRQSVALATGQFRGSSGAGVQRLDNEVDLAIQYAPLAEDDFTAPVIRQVDSTITGGQLVLDVDAVDSDGANGSSAITRVYVLVAPDPGSGVVDWVGVDLERSGTSGRWIGSVSLPSGVDTVEFIVQAVDAAGNVGYQTNKGANFSDIEQPPPPPPEGVDITITPTAGVTPNAAGWYSGPVTVGVAGSVAPVQYQLDGGPLLDFPASGLALTQPGLNSLRITTAVGVVERVVLIDQSAPSAVIGSPITGSVVPRGTSLTATYSCTDLTLTGCVGTIRNGPTGTPSPLANGADLSTLAAGSYVITVTATDSFGRTRVVTSAVTFQPTQVAPSIVSITGPTTPRAINTAVAIDATFRDPNGAADNYSVVVDWGVPGSTPTKCSASETTPKTGNPSCSISSQPTATSNGHALASYQYATSGVYTVQVTITDGAGGTATSAYEFAVVYDTAGGQVTGAGGFWSGPTAYPRGGRLGSAAVFGYEAKYKKPTDAKPSGATSLRLIGDLFFQSVSYDYLVVNGAMAVAEGTGKIDGRSGYRFRVSGVDNGWIDFFELKIWDQATGAVIYDNGVLYDKGDLVLLGDIKVQR